MATRKRVKKNIKEDQLVTYAVRVSRWTQEHFNHVIIGVVGLVVVIAIVVFTANSRQGSSKEAEMQLSSAMQVFQVGNFSSARMSFEQIADRFGGRSWAISTFFVAECDFRQGKFTEAMESYRGYLGKYNDYPEFRASAMIGVALCYEGLGDYGNAARAMVDALGVLDTGDPRYLDCAYRAGEFFATAGDREQAATYYREVSEGASGDLKDKASVAAALLSK